MSATVPPIDEVALEYNRMAFGLGEAVGEGETYREVRLNDWSPHVHYEFLPQSRGYAIELHWQADDRPGLDELFDRLAEDAQVVFSRHRVDRSRREVQRHLVSVKLRSGLSAQAVAKEMHHFVAWTRPRVGGAVG